MLEGVGLGPEQEATYLTMLAHPGQSLEEIAARHPDRPRSQTVAAVEALVELGLATQLAGTPPQYTAIAPDVGVEGLVRARVDDARRASQAIPALMERFWETQRRTGSIDSIEVITSMTAIAQRWAQLQRAVSREVRAFDRPPYFASPTRRPNPVELQRLADGVAYRVIYEQEVLDVPGRWPDLEAGFAAGEQSRVLPDLPAKLALFDGFAATLPIKTRSFSLIVVHSSPLLAALSALFEAYWERAIPLDLGERPAEPGRGDEEELIRLLTAGLGDQAIQRALGVSGSTVHRRVRALMARLGARSRFQAGFQLGRTLRGRP